MKKLPLNFKIYILIIYLITFISFLVFFKIEHTILYSIRFDIYVIFYIINSFNRKSYSDL